PAPPAAAPNMPPTTPPSTATSTPTSTQSISSAPSRGPNPMRCSMSFPRLRYRSETPGKNLWTRWLLTRGGRCRALPLRACVARRVGGTRLHEHRARLQLHDGVHEVHHPGERTPGERGHVELHDLTAMHVLGEALGDLHYGALWVHRLETHQLRGAVDVVAETD